MSTPPQAPIKGRGATFNPGNRFRRDTREAVDDGWTPPAEGKAEGEDGTEVVHEARGENDLADAAKTAVINKRAGGTGLILIQGDCAGAPPSSPPP